MTRAHSLLLAINTADSGFATLRSFSRLSYRSYRALSIPGPAISPSHFAATRLAVRRPACTARVPQLLSSHYKFSPVAPDATPAAVPSGFSVSLRLLRRSMSSSSNRAASPGAAEKPEKPSSSSSDKIFFGTFDVSTQVFYSTPLSFAFVNLKPLLPGHVLVCPKRPHRRLTDLDAAELTDLFSAVQVVQRMLAAYYFGDAETNGNESGEQDQEQVNKGSFNLAVQDGPEAGQTVSHVHVHILPRIRGTTAKAADSEGDALYEKMADEPGNVGGAQWDAASDEERQGSGRPKPGGKFPRIEDSSREARTMEAMEAEAAEFRRTLASLGVKQAA